MPTPKQYTAMLKTDLGKCKDLYELDEVIDALADCTLKGYLMCKLEIFSESSDNVYSAKAMLIKTIDTFNC